MAQIISNEELSAGSLLTELKIFSTFRTAKRNMARPGALLVFKNLLGAQSDLPTVVDHGQYADLKSSQAKRLIHTYDDFKDMPSDTNM